MANYNKVILIGNSTQDAGIRYLPSGVAVCNFDIAVNRNYKKNNEWEQEVSFFPISIFGERAERVASTVFKGVSCLVEGKLKQETWQDKETGKKRSKVVVIADAVKILEKKEKESINQNKEGSHSGMPEPPQLNQNGTYSDNNGNSAPEQGYKPNLPQDNFPLNSQEQRQSSNINSDYMPF